MFHRVGKYSVNLDGGAVTEWAKSNSTSSSTSSSSSTSNVDLYSLLYGSDSDELTEEEKEQQRLANETTRLNNQSIKISNLNAGAEAVGTIFNVGSQIVKSVGGWFANLFGSVSTDATADTGASAGTGKAARTANNINETTANLKEAVSNYQDTGDYETLKSAISEANSAKASCENQLKSLNNSTELSKLEKNKTDLEKDQEKIEKNIETADSDIKTAEQDKTNYENGDYKKAVEGKETAVNNCDAMTKAFTEAEVAKNNAETNLNQKEANYTSLSNYLQQAKISGAPTDGIEAQVNAAKTAYETAKNDYETAKNEYNTAEKNKNDAETKKSEAEVTLEDAKVKLDDLKGAVTKKEKEKEQLEQDRENVTDKLTKAQEEFNTKQADINAQKKTLQGALDGLNSQLEKAEEEGALRKSAEERKKTEEKK